jgi:ADP-ribose pyrophosphatase
LREETGYKAKTWTKLASFWPSPGYVSEKMTIFLASDLTEGEQEQMEDERIEIQWFPAREVAGMIRDGKIMDGKTMIGYFIWMDQKRNRTASVRERRKRPQATHS